MVNASVSVKWDKPINSEKDKKDMLLFFQKSLIDIGRETLSEAEAEGFDKDAVIRTDNKWYKPITSIKPFGKVEWTARTDISEAMREIYIKLIQNSPIDTGLYSRNNLVYVGSKLIARNFGQLDSYLKNNDIDPKLTIRFINSMPYARRLELLASSFGGGRTRKSGTSKAFGAVSKPNGNYAMAYRALKSKYGNIGFFDYRNFASGEGGVMLPTPPSGMRTNRVTDGRPYVYPSIRIKPFAAGGRPQ